MSSPAETTDFKNRSEVRPTVAAQQSTVAWGALAGVALACVSALIILAIGNVGAPVRVVTGGAPDGADLSVAEVLITSTVAVVLGAALLWFLERRGPNGLRTWTIIAAFVAVASAVPLLRLNVGADSKIALSAMHLATGVSAVSSQFALRRRTQQR